LECLLISHENGTTAVREYAPTVYVSGYVFEPFISKSAVLSFEHISFLVLIQLLVSRIERRNRLG